MRTQTLYDRLPERIVTYPDPVLRERCRPVEQFGQALESLVGRMLELMKAGRGVGLAAPQVGLPLRLFVANPTGRPDDDRVYVNPRIVEAREPVEAEEGCLSLPEVHILVKRGRCCVIQACDLRGEAFEETGCDLPARIWQHEIDHLDGRLLIDRMTPADRLEHKAVLAGLEAAYARRRKPPARRPARR